MKKREGTLDLETEKKRSLEKQRTYGETESKEIREGNIKAKTGKARWRKA